MKRALATTALVAGLTLFAGTAPAIAQTAASTGQAPALQAPAEPPATTWYGAPADRDPQAHQDEIVRTMYVTMGAMAGYMFAVMPVTSAAVTAAVASGVASMWAYDYMLAPQAAAE